MRNFDFKEDVILENSRVLLRPLLVSDYNNLIDFVQYEPELWRYYSVDVFDKDFLLNYINSALKAREAGMEYAFIVFDKLYGEYAGSTRFCDIQLTKKTLQLGFTWYGKKFQGTGLNKNCKFLLLEHAFEKMKIERVEFKADCTNERSILAMKSIGCFTEGILRSTSDRLDGSRRDAIVLSIIKDEWINKVRLDLMNKLI